MLRRSCLPLTRDGLLALSASLDDAMLAAVELYPELESGLCRLFVFSHASLRN